MRAGPVLLLLLKWIVIPITLLGVGFYFIGPRIGQSDAGQDVASPQSQPQDSDQDKPKVVRHGEPQVEVSVRPGSSFHESSRDFSGSSISGDNPPPKKHKRHRRRIEPTEPPPDIPFDPGPPPPGISDTGGGGGGPGGGGGGPGGPGGPGY